MFLPGRVAQLGEHSVRIREVVGSNPISSTKKAQAYVKSVLFVLLKLFFQMFRLRSRI